MPRKVPLPSHLVGTAFLTSDASFHALGRGRLRGNGVEHAFHGVSSIGLDLVSVIDLCRAFEPMLRRGQCFSHSTAALLFGMPLPRSIGPSPLHLSQVDSRRSSRAAGVVGHQLTLARVSVELQFGLPLIGAADTWFQLASMLSREDLVAAGDYLISGTRNVGGTRSEPICSLAELQDAVARHAGSRGSKSAAWAITRLRTGVDSRPESLMRLILDAADIQDLEIGVPTVVDGGRLTLHGDLTNRRLRVVFEYEGNGHFTSSRRFRSDITRRELFEAAKYRVIRVTADDVFVDPDSFIRRVRRVLAQRESEV